MHPHVKVQKRSRLHHENLFFVYLKNVASIWHGPHTVRPPQAPPVSRVTAGSLSMIRYFPRFTACAHSAENHEHLGHFGVAVPQEIDPIGDRLPPERTIVSPGIRNVDRVYDGSEVG